MSKKVVCQMGIGTLLAALCLVTGCGRAPSATEETYAMRQTEATKETYAVRQPEATKEGRSEEASYEEPPRFEEEGGERYAYHTLSESERSWYRDMNRILGNMLSDQELCEEGLESGLTENDLDKIFQCVLNDHPEYFFVEGYTYTKYTRLNDLVKLEFSGTYSCGLEEAELRQGRIRLAAEQLLGGIREEMSDYEKVKYVYDTLVANTEYDLTASDNQNIYSVFVNRASVCQGYAKATQYLLHRLGIPCTVVLGTVDTGEGHAWNLVRIEGEYYYVDTTWGDASYQAEGELSEYMPEINYDYLCVNTEQLLRTHVPDDLIPLPECKSLDANYYVREGTYFTDYDEEKLNDIFARAAEKGLMDVTLKCADDPVYEEMAKKLIEEKGIFQYMKSAEGRIAYARNEKQLSLTFWVTNE